MAANIHVTFLITNSYQKVKKGGSEVKMLGYEISKACGGHLVSQRDIGSLAITIAIEESRCIFNRVKSKLPVMRFGCRIDLWYEIR